MIMRKGVAVGAALVLVAVVAWVVVGSRTALTDVPESARLPDLRVLPAEDLRFDTVEFDTVTHDVNRFTTTSINLGVGPLHVTGRHNPEAETTSVTQHLFDGGGEEVATRHVGEFVFHEGHNHWHMDNFLLHELYRAESGRTRDGAEPDATEKISFCLRDSRHVVPLDGTPGSDVYGSCGEETQGISVGWGDVYSSSLDGQWIDLGPADDDPPLADGEYAIALTVDPDGAILESDATNNRAVVYFSVESGQIIVRETERVA